MRNSPLTASLSVSIKWSLLAAVLFLLAVLALVSVLSDLQLNSLQGSIETMGRDRLPEVQRLGEFELAATRIRLTAIRQALATSPERKAEAAALLEQRLRQLNERIAEHQQAIKNDPSASLLFAQFAAQWKSYVSLQTRLTDPNLSSGADLDHLVNVDSFGAFNDVVASIGDNIKFASLRAEDAVVGVEAQSHTFSIAVVAINVVSVLIGLATLAFVVREVSLPIRRMTEAMEQIAKGRLDTDIPYADRANELGMMAKALAIFRKSLIENARLSAATRTLSELSEWLQTAKTEAELFSMISSVLGRLMPECRGTLYTYGASRDVLDVAAHWNGSQRQQSIQPDDCWGLRRGHAYVYGVNEVEFACPHCNDSHSSDFCCIPILARGETVGLLHLEYAFEGVETREERKIRFADRARLGRACAEHISVAIANAKLRETLLDQSTRDPLTALPNRRGFQEAAARIGAAAGVMVIDVDHFKTFNDRHGHDAGDAVLRAVGKCMAKLFERPSFPCRYGGEEFIALLPGADAEATAARAEELRAAIEALSLSHRGIDLPKVTVSIGVATVPSHGEELETVMKAADEALYQAKADGRNRVTKAISASDLKALANVMAESASLAA